MSGERARAVHQVVGALHRGDAVGNEVLAIRTHLRAQGFASDVFAGWVDPRLGPDARPLSEHAGEDDPRTATVYHFSPGSPATAVARAAAGPLVVMYHNVTPAAFFSGYSDEMVRLATCAADELSALAPRAALGLAKSEFSRRDLEAAGFGRTGVLPLLLGPGARTRPSAVVRRLYRDGRLNVLAVGRVVPNKRLEHLVAAFAVLQRTLVPRSRLLLVGDLRLEAYVFRLEEMVRQLRVSHVEFLGHVDDDELRACYEVADLFVSTSEHEGYGAPLVEAMLAGVPVLARDAGAVAETLAGAGVLFDDPSPALLAGLADRMLNDRELRRSVLAGQERAAARIRTRDEAADLRVALAPVVGP